MGGAYLQREICFSKSIGLALLLEGNLPFLLCFTLYLRAISKYKPPRGGGAYIWRGDLMDRLATSGPLGERSGEVSRGLRPAPYEIRRRTFLKVYLTEGFLRYEFGGLIFGGVYFRYFTVSLDFLFTSA